MHELLVVHRGYAGEKLNEFIGRGRRGTSPGGMRRAGYYKRLRTPGSWNIGFNADDERVLQVLPYHTMEFWLRDLYGGAEYDAFLASLPTYRKDSARPGWWRDFSGMVLTQPKLNQGADGVYSSSVWGRGNNEVLYTEFIDYAESTSGASKSGAAETVAKAYVNENIGPGAGLDAGGYSRVRTGLSVESDGGTGGTWSGDRSYKLLGDVLQEIANVTTGPGDYMVVQTGDRLLQFQWRSPHWGLDKRVGNGVRRPMLFSARMQNVGSVQSSISYLGSVSGVIVHGQGVGPLQKSGTAYDITLTSLTDWARKVIIREERDAVDQAALNAIASGELYNNWPEVEVDVETKQILSSRYGVHWQVGDLVTAEDTVYGRQVDRKVTAVRVSASADDGVVTVTPEMGDFIDG